MVSQKEIDERLQSVIDSVIEAANYGAEDAIIGSIGNLGHVDFSNSKIVFDLRGKNNYASCNKDIIEKAVENMSKDFYDRVSYLED